MMIVRPSQVDAWLTCGRKFYYQYVMGLLSNTGAANLYFGTSLHHGIEVFLKTYSVNDSLTAFVDKWNEYTRENIIEYPQPFCRDSLRKTGLALIENFHAWWPSSNFSIVNMKDGSPAIERRLKVRISEDVVLSGTPDLIATDGIGVGPLDWKSVKTQHTQTFADLSDQLTAYDLLLTANRDLFDLSDKPIAFAAFIDLQKKKVPEPLKKDPTKYAKNAVFPGVFPPIISRTNRQEFVNEYIQKVQWVADNIRAGNFFRVSGKAFNSPCNSCDYSKHCVNGSIEGLTRSKSRFKVDCIAKDIDDIPYVNVA